MLREGFSDIVTLSLGSHSKIAQSWLSQDMLRKYYIETVISKNAELEDPIDFDVLRNEILTEKKLSSEAMIGFLETWGTDDEVVWFVFFTETFLGLMIFFLGILVVGMRHNRLYVLALALGWVYRCYSF